MVLRDSMSYRKGRKSHLESADRVLEKLLQKNSNLSNQFMRWQLWKDWPLIVGKTVAEHTDPVGFYRGTLYVWVKNSSWHQELIFLAKPIKDKINTHLKKKWLRSVKFTLDRKSVPNREEMSADSQQFLSKGFPNEDEELPLDP